MYDSIPILVIEDNDKHWDQILECLTSKNFDAKRLKNGDRTKMENYLALYPGTQIIIVDLNLGNGDENEGWTILKEILWPSNRTAYFILFSERIEGKANIHLDEAGPHVTFALKNIDNNDKLEAKSLAHLLDVTTKYANYVSPILTTPHYTSYRYFYTLQSFINGLPKADRKVVASVFGEQVSNSIKRLNFCVDAARYFDNAGIVTKNIGVGVFGSCGRLEAREKSDIEYIILQKSTTSKEQASMLQLSCGLWNRLRIAIDSSDYECEINTNIISSSNNLLTPQDVKNRTFDFTVIGNEYIPVLDEKIFLDAKKTSLENLRNKIFQMLTEMRPVFNPEYLQAATIRALEEVIDVSPLPSINQLIELNSFSRIFEQFSLSTHPESLENNKDLKKFLFRTLHVITTKIELIRIRCCENANEDISQNNFIMLLKAPPLDKIAKMHREILMAGTDDIDQKLKDLLLKYLAEIAARHAELLKLLSNDDVPDSKTWRASVRTKANECYEKYNTFVKNLGKAAVFHPAIRIPWLFSIPAKINL